MATSKHQTNRERGEGRREATRSETRFRAPAGMEPLPDKEGEKTRGHEFGLDVICAMVRGNGGGESE